MDNATTTPLQTNNETTEQFLSRMERCITSKNDIPVSKIFINASDVRRLLDIVIQSNKE